MKKYQTFSEKETKNLAAKLAKELKNRIIALTGQLGAGKTIFVQGFAEGLGIKEKIISPTFVLQRIHKIPNTNTVLHHIDLYRLEGEGQLKQLGLDDLFNDSRNIVLIEWAEKLRQLPKEAILITINREGLSKRRFIIHNS